MLVGWIREIISKIRRYIKLGIIGSIVYNIWFYSRCIEGNIIDLYRAINSGEILEIYYSNIYGFIYKIVDGWHVVYCDILVAQDVLNMIKVTGIESLKYTYVYNIGFWILVFIIWTMIDRILKKMYDEMEEEEEISRITFDDIVGLEETKEELREILYMNNNRGLNAVLKTKKLKGILFHGPPGNGKTMMAKAIANELECGFICVSASEFMEIYVGVGPQKIRNLFEKARGYKRCVIFIDELDAIGKSRGKDNNSERDSTVNQLLVEMDGVFSDKDDIFIIGATNCDLNEFDSALMRRFEIILDYRNPNLEEINELLKRLLKDIPHANVRIPFIASGLMDMSRANICTVVELAKRLAIYDKRNFINEQDLDEASLRITMGKKLNEFKISKHEKWLTCYHEAGHAYIAYYYHNNGTLLAPPRYLTVVPRSNALGFVQIPDTDEYQSKSVDYINAHMRICYAGIVCEGEFTDRGSMSIGCSGDLISARRYAEYYVHYGLDESVGNVGRTNDQQYMSINESNDKYDRIKVLCDSNRLETVKLVQENREIILNIATEAYYCDVVMEHRLEYIINNKNTIDYRLCPLNKISWN